MKRQEWMLDSRTPADLCRRVEELAASYTPEWKFDQKDPDMGSTLALLYTGQMADNIRRMNRVPEKYHTEFVNLLGLNLKPAHPACGVVVVDLMRGTVPGVALPQGSRLMAEGKEGEAIVFETMRDVYITNARLSDVLSVSGARGQIHPLLGGPSPVKLNPETDLEPESEEKEKGENEVSYIEPFALFDYQEPGVEKNALLLYHRSVFGAEPGLPIYIHPVTPEGRSVAKEWVDPTRWRWSYIGENGIKPFEEVRLQGDMVALRRENASVPVTVDNVPYHMICLEALKPIQESVTIQDLRMVSQKEPSLPQMILHNGEELNGEKCMPFGNTVSLFDECYICDDHVFVQQDATITLSFSLSSKKKLLRLTPEQESNELKVIKRKPRAVQYQTASAAPERIALEYFNGQIWRRLPETRDWETIFDGKHSGVFQISFPCPADWASVPINGYEGRCLRLRVTQADNCYLLPSEHTMPVLENLQLAYTYEGVWKQPQKLSTVCGTVQEDQTLSLLNGESVTVFRPLPYPPASLYLGFDRALEGAPVSVLFHVEESVHFRMDPVVFEYSTRNGFRQMKVLDGTENFSRTGTMLFMPPSDFAPMEVEGVRRWWLRLCGEESVIEGYHPLLKNIALNAVDIRNQQIQPEETFYVEATAPDMVFPLAQGNIISADVFVGEQDYLTRQQMQEMMAEKPQDVRVEYDFLGEIAAFYVRWTEVETFDRSQSEDRHYMIDRSRNLLIFGDGVHVRIPQAQQGPAILVQTVCSDGAAGNVPVGAVNSFYGNVMYVESVHNPMETYAGSDMETLDSVQRRGADMISNHGRLISQQDFVRAVKAFSGTVEKVKCLAGWDIDGRPNPSKITIALMTRDYAAGAYSFKNIRDPLQRQLLEQCDATVTPNCLVVAEPVYVEIFVSVWVKVDDADHAFEVQDLIKDSLKEFLDPLPRANHSGWEIGVLPTENQVRMLLQSLRFQGHIDRMVAVARYVDRDGTHEAALGQFPEMPFAIGVNGEHKVYIEFQ